jgi:glycerol-3-phosphate acyltransferase PlsY
MAPVLALFVSTVWLTRFVSLGSILASVALGPIAWALDAPTPVITAAVGATVVILIRHRSNLGRLTAGTERRLGQRVGP